MLSKEQILDIISYCNENKISWKERLRDLGLSEWAFYSARRKYLNAERGEGCQTDRFIQLSNSGRFVPDSVSEMEQAVNPGKKLSESPADEFKIECQTSRGGMIRMSGKLTPTLLSTLLQSL